jgi:hypothetical protein
MSIDYYGRLPRLLQDEFVEGRWLPIVGAGMSANAAASGDRRPPMWSSLGSQVAAYLSKGSGGDGPVDAISTFEQQYGRLPLVDKLRDLLLIDEVRPTEPNLAFARIPFDTVLTSNIDFVLEDAWRELRWPFEPILGEQRLASRRRRGATLLVKFHGDVHHPDSLIVTEKDYDRFLHRFPLLATYVSSLLITRVPVLFGYSADDPDFRNLLAMLSERLGRNSATPWVILAKGTAAQVARYERRGVKAGVLDSRPNAAHGTVLATFFSQLADALPAAAGSRAEATEDALLTALRVTHPSASLILFIGGNEQLARYRELLFPVLRARGLNPVTPDDVQSAPSLALASIKQLVRRASVVVVDVRERERLHSADVGVALASADVEQLIVVAGRSLVHSLNLGSMNVLPTEDDSDASVTSHLAEAVMERIVQRTQTRPTGMSRESIRLRLAAGDTTMAFLEAVIAVESALRRETDTHFSSFRQLVHESPLSQEQAQVLQEAYKFRSEFLHHGVHPPPQRVAELTSALLTMMGALEGNDDVE